jgi:hypothetical protein
VPWPYESPEASAARLPPVEWQHLPHHRRETFCSDTTSVNCPDIETSVGPDARSPLTRKPLLHRHQDGREPTPRCRRPNQIRNRRALCDHRPWKVCPRRSQ